MFPRHCRKDEEHKAHTFWSPSGLKIVYLCRGGAWSQGPMAHLLPKPSPS